MKDENAIHADIAFRAIVLNIDQGLLGVDGRSLCAGRYGGDQGEKESELEWACHHGGIIRVASGSGRTNRGRWGKGCSRQVSCNKLPFMPSLLRRSQTARQHHALGMSTRLQQTLSWRSGDVVTGIQD